MQASCGGMVTVLMQNSPQRSKERQATLMSGGTETMRISLPLSVTAVAERTPMNSFREQKLIHLVLQVELYAQTSETLYCNRG